MYNDLGYFLKNKIDFDVSLDMKNVEGNIIFFRVFVIKERNLYL